MTTPSTIALLLAMAAPAAGARGAPGGAWELVDGDAGVRLYRLRDRPARLLAVTAVSARIESVAAVLRDTPAFPAWLDACREATRVAAVDAEHMTLHLLMGFPLGVRRDVVLRAEVTYDLGRARGGVDLAAIEGAAVPVPAGALRMRAFEGAFVLEYLGRERTGIAYTFEADPGIAAPAFLVDRATRTMIRNTVRRLGEAAATARYVEAGRDSRDRALFEGLLADEERVRAAVRARLLEHFRDPEAIDRLVADRAVVDLLARGDGHLAEALFLSRGSRDAREAVARAVLRAHAAGTRVDRGAPEEQLGSDAALVSALVDGR